MTITGLLQRLEQRGCQVKVEGEKLKVKGPLTGELRQAIRQHKPELLALLGAYTCCPFPNSNKVVRLYRAREACMEAGHCMQLTKETGCNLFPLTWRWRWCRETVPAGRRKRNNGASKENPWLD